MKGNCHSCQHIGEVSWMFSFWIFIPAVVMSCPMPGDGYLLCYDGLWLSSSYRCEGSSTLCCSLMFFVLEESWVFGHEDKVALLLDVRGMVPYSLCYLKQVVLDRWVFVSCMGWRLLSHLCCCFCRVYGMGSTLPHLL